MTNLQNLHTKENSTGFTGSTNINRNDMILLVEHQFETGYFICVRLWSHVGIITDSMFNHNVNGDFTVKHQYGC